jgi:dsDNA-specific endonuclease/ATPase MutS2
VGERARSRSGGWFGRIAALERGGGRATLEAGGMRVTVEVDDLEPEVPTGPARAGGSAGRAAEPVSAGGRGGRPGPGTEATSGLAALRLEKARTVASSLDLRGARVEEALELLDRYLDDASLAGLVTVTVVHGSGTGALRDAVRAAAGGHPLVRSARPGGRGEGGDGATIITF